MIPSKAHQITTTGGLPGKKTAMTIDAVHMPHIMNVLTNMYSDIEKAILRELSANALDSHIEAGQTRPIEIRTPDVYHPFLEIEDFGVGMSIDFVENHFSKYGASTKRDNNDQVGAFGIGGKSPLAYTDSYTMRTRKDGIEGLFVISRNDEGMAEITTVGEPVKTNEPNGVLFSIPAKSTDDFTAKVEWMFKFWEPGTVLVNGEPPRGLLGEKLTDDITYLAEGGQSYVVMGNIPYRIANVSSFIPDHGMRQFSFVARVPIGSVQPTPSREDLEYGDEATLDTLRKVGKTFSEKMLESIHNEITSAPNHFEAWNRWNHWRQKVSLGDITYKGDKFTDTVSVSGYRWVPGARYGLRRAGSSTYSGNVRLHEIAEHALVIVKDKTQRVPFGEPSGYDRTKTRWYVRENNLSRIHRYFFLDEIPKSPWINGMNIVEWDEIKKTKNPDYVPRPKKEKGTIEVMTHDKLFWNTVNLDDLPDDDLLIVSAYEAKNKNMAAVMRAFIGIGKKPTLVKVPANRHAKFVRTHPKAEQWNEYARRQASLIEAEIPKEAWVLRGFDSKTTFFLSKLKADMVNDPELKVAVDTLSKKDKYMRKFEAAYEFSVAVGVTLKDKTEKNDWVAERYPLLNGIDTWYWRNNSTRETMDEMYFYLNSKYETTKE